MNTAIVILACFATLAAAVYSIRRGAAFASFCYPDRKWAAVMVAFGILLVAGGVALIFGHDMPGWLSCVVVVILGFGGGIAARMKQYEMRDNP
jgi:hypothetical protein